MKMTIHRALSELKIIDSRIEKAIENTRPVGFIQKGKLVNGRYEEEAFKTDAKASIQSVTDLIERKQKIKSAIVKANNETEVAIGNKKMTIAEAINFKHVIASKKMFISDLVRKLDAVNTEIHYQNDKTESEAIRLAEAALKKDNVKIGDNDAVAITKPYIESREYKLVDPLGIEKLIVELQEEVNRFEVEVDATLSEANATTTIDI